MLSTRKTLLAFTGACIAASLGGAIVFTHMNNEARSRQVLSANFSMPPGGMHGAPLPVGSAAAQQNAYKLAKNAWSDPEN